MWFGLKCCGGLALELCFACRLERESEKPSRGNASSPTEGGHLKETCIFLSGLTLKHLFSSARSTRVERLRIFGVTAVIIVIFTTLTWCFECACFKASPFKRRAHAGSFLTTY